MPHLTKDALLEVIALGDVEGVDKRFDPRILADTALDLLRHPEV